MPIPTTSPLAISFMSIGSSVSSTRWGSPHFVPVAAARTYSHLGVITATPKERLLGLIRCTREDTETPLRELQYHTVSQNYTGIKPAFGRAGRSRYGTPFTTDHEQAAARAGPDCQAQRQ